MMSGAAAAVHFLGHPYLLLHLRPQLHLDPSPHPHPLPYPHPLPHPRLHPHITNRLNPDNEPDPENCNEPDETENFSSFFSLNFPPGWGSLVPVLRPLPSATPDDRRKCSALWCSGPFPPPPPVDRRKRSAPFHIYIFFEWPYRGGPVLLSLLVKNQKGPLSGVHSLFDCR